jgi:hypothetical protein
MEEDGTVDCFSHLRYNACTYVYGFRKEIIAKVQRTLGGINEIQAMY